MVEVATRLFAVMRRLLVDSGETHRMEVEGVSQRSGRLYWVFSSRNDGGGGYCSTIEIWSSKRTRLSRLTVQSWALISGGKEFGCEG